MTGVLLKAVSAGRPRQVRLLLDSGISLEVEDSCGQTALIRAIFVDHARTRDKLLQMLLRGGALVSHVDIVGRNALSWACLYGRERDVTLLINHADVDLDFNQQDVNGQTALFHAVTSGNAAVVKLIMDVLLKYGLSLDVVNNRGISPLMQAIKLGHDVCSSILVHQGNATAGLNMKSPEDVHTWAAKSHETTHKEMTTPASPPIPSETHIPSGKRYQKSQTQQNRIFPPLVPPSCMKVLCDREAKALQNRIVTPADSDDDSTYGSEASFYTDDSYDLAAPGGGGFNRRRKPGSSDEDTSGARPPAASALSLRTISLTSSTEAIVDSSDEDVDCFSTPVEPPKPGFEPMTDLPQLYNLYEAQHSAAYRPAAVPRPKDLSVMGSTDSLAESMVSTDSAATDTSRRKSNKTTGRKGTASTWSDLRRSMLRKNLVVKSKVPEDSLCHNTVHVSGDSSDSDSSDRLFVPCKAGVAPPGVLPRITPRRGMLVQNGVQVERGNRDVQKQGKNYSNV